MGLTLGLTSLIAIVAKQGKDGLTKEEILKMNNETYKVDPLKEYFSAIIVLAQNYIEKRGERYFLKKDCNLSSSWLEEQLERLERRKK